MNKEYEEPSKIVALIDERRSRLGLSQKELGELVGVNQAAVAKWFSGKRDISSRKLDVIFQNLGLAVVVAGAESQTKRRSAT